MGTTRHARRAGIAQAASATAARARATAVKVNGTRTGMPNTRLDTVRPSAKPPSSPAPIPINASLKPGEGQGDAPSGKTSERWGCQGKRLGRYPRLGDRAEDAGLNHA